MTSNGDLRVEITRFLMVVALSFVHDSYLGIKIDASYLGIKIDARTSTAVF